MKAPRPSQSLRRRLLIQLLGVAAVLSALIYFGVRAIAEQAAEATQDNILGASATTIAEELAAQDGEIVVDIPYAAFSMLGAINAERVFYRIETDAETLTGYDDLPLPAIAPSLLAPVYYTINYRGVGLRVVALQRLVTVQDRPVVVTIIVGQTRNGHAAITSRVANLAASLGIGFFILAGLLNWVATERALGPVRRVALAVGRRGPADLSPLRQPMPRELAPLSTALNDFMARLRAALTRTETFIAEAAHHVRTPLATVRSQAEIALRLAETEDSRRALRAVIRAVEESGRSAGQLLDHAMVTFRSEHLEPAEVDLSEMLSHALRALTPSADIKDVTLQVSPLDTPAKVLGDQLLIESAIRNMLDNAIKYTPADSTVTISLGQVGGSHVLEICDQGRGLAGADLAALSIRFERGNNVADVVGSGLGLTIIQEVATSHGGSFTLAQMTEGVCAKLSLPCYVPA